MKVLYIGGTGEISYDCVHESLRAGHHVYVYNRGGPRNLTLPAEVIFLTGDVHDDSAYSKLASYRFDVVCQFRLFKPDELRRDLKLFTGHCGQYVFISTAAAYQKPVLSLPITEDTPLGNLYWPYAQAKQEMEWILRTQEDLPYTIVRPSDTYRTRMPTPLNYHTDVSRMIRGRPVIVPGDGESLWTVTHGRDFAPPFVRLLGNPRALHEAFHITSDQAWSWNHIMEVVAEALGVTNYQLAHVPTDTLIQYSSKWLIPIKGDKCFSLVFDNSKVKSVAGVFDCPVDLYAGTKLVAEQFPPDPQNYDAKEDALHDRIVREQWALG